MNTYNMRKSLQNQKRKEAAPKFPEVRSSFDLLDPATCVLEKTHLDIIFSPSPFVATFLRRRMVGDCGQQG